NAADAFAVHRPRHDPQHLQLGHHHLGGAELAGGIQRRQHAQPVRLRDRQHAVPPDRAGPAADPARHAQSRRHRPVADRRAADHLFPAAAVARVRAAVSREGAGPATGPFTPVADGVRIAVRLTPKASRNAVVGLAATADGGSALKVTVTAVPQDGRANAALIRLLAREWRIAKSDLTIAAGHADRNKTLLARGDAAALMARLQRWLADREGGAG